ncbi:fibronectin type III domain-containing protein [Kribbella sp. NBC_01245]|uniref:fibronectin type III domain-containing protein n=1 Tax=Kribbella sp. NBC_01245 TaxID=2903578 RepID=UPI002E29F1B2|nr:fibronectin type III domain-containing protein [Kribbella sp. NBC_01245]
MRYLVVLAVLATGLHATSTIQPSVAVAAPNSTAAPTAAAAAAPGAGGGLYVPLATTQRLYDSGTTLVQAQETKTATFTGLGGIPATGVTAIAATVQVLSPTASGSLPAWPAGETRPAVSGLLFAANMKYMSGSAVIRLNASGQASFSNKSAGTLRIRVDVTGYFTGDTATTAGSRFVPLKQSRIVDTRAKIGVGGTAPVAANGTITFQVAGVGGLPAASSISAVAVNVTALVPSAFGGWTLFPAGATRPGVNHGLHVQTRPKTGSSIVKVATDGRLSLTNTSTGTTHFTVDVTGYFTSASNATAASSRVVALSSRRVLDTGTTLVAAGGTVNLRLTGVGGIPASNVAAAAINLVASGSATSGEFKAYTAGQSAPAATDVIFAPSPHQFNQLWVRPNASGDITIANRTNAAARLYVDVQGYALNPGKPQAPTNVIAQAGDRSAAVSWTAPADTGDLTISGYTVKVSPGGAEIPSATPNASIPNLDNGTSYTFTVTARTATGSSAPSEPSAGITPAKVGPPGAPVITGVAGMDSAAIVEWSPPPETAGAVTSYTITVQPGGRTVQAAADATSTTVTGLTNGSTYQFTIAATNAHGTGAASPLSRPVTTRPAEVPMAPVLDSVVAGPNRIDVQWAPPADGGAPITSYRVTLTPGGQQQIVEADTTVAAFVNLTNGTSYSASVVAVNKAGTSEPATRAGLVPVATRVPGRPLNVSVSSTASGSLVVTWQPPTDPGSSAVTGYTVTAAPGGRTATVGATARTATITGLDPAASYTVRTTASNAAGAGTAEVSEPTRASVTATSATPNLLSAESLAGLAEYRTDGTLVFSRPSAQVNAFKVGDVVASLPDAKLPLGIMRRITQRVVQGTALFLSTEQMPLNGLLTAGGITSDQVLTNDSTTELLSAPGTKRSQPLIDGKTRRQGAPRREQVNKIQGGEVTLMDGQYTFTFFAEVGAEQGFAGAVEGSVSVKPNLITKIDFGTPTKTEWGYTVDAHADIRWRAGFVAKLLSKEWEVQRIRGPRIVVMAGPVPIVLTTELKIMIRLDVEGNVGVQLRYSYGREVGAKIKTEGSTITPEVVNRTYDVNAGDVQLYAAATARLAAPMIGFYVYLWDVAGPGILASPFTELEVDLTQDPWWTLDLGVQLGAYLGISDDMKKIFGQEFGWEDDSLLEVKVTIAHAGGPFAGLKVDPAKAEIPTNTPLKLNPTVIVAGVPTTPDNVEWSIVKGPGSVAADGTYVSPVSGAALVKAHIDETPATEEMNFEVGILVGNGPPAAPAAPYVEPGAGSLNISWRPPTHNGGDPVKRYAITTVPATSTTWVEAPARTARIRGVTPGRTYRVQIAAANSIALGPLSTLSAEVVPVSIGLTITGTPQDINTTEYGAPNNSGYTTDFKMSGDGQYVYFAAAGHSNVIPLEARSGIAYQYLVRRSLWTGRIDLISRGDDGVTPWPIEGGVSTLPQNGVFIGVSRTGDRVAYQEDGNPSWTGDIVVRDLPTGRTIGRYPLPAGETLYGIKLNDDGTVLSFSTLLPRKPSGAPNANLYRAQPGVSGSATEIAGCFISCADDHETTNFDMDGSGNTIVWETCGGPTDGCRVRRWAGGTKTDLLSQPVDSEEAHDPKISDDGSYIAVAYTNAAGSSKGLAVVPAGAARITAQAVRATYAADREVMPMNINRDATKIIYAVGAASGTGAQPAYILNRSSGAATLLAPSESVVMADNSDDGTLAAYTQYLGPCCSGTFGTKILVRKT